MAKNDLRPQRVLVTGATGFVGRALIPRLLGAGRAVRAAVRRPDEPLPAGVEAWSVPDIGPDTDWSVALRGIDAIVHLAARAHVLGASTQEAHEAYRAVNALATIRLAEFAAKCGVKRLVFMSSARVHGSRTMGVPFTETSPFAADDPYGRSKAEAELGLANLAHGALLETVVLRPPLVYGPNARGNFARLTELVARGMPLPLGAVQNRRSLISLDNLVDATVRCLDHPAAAGKTFLVSDGEELSTPALVRRIANALGRPARLFPVPAAMLRLAGALVGRSDDVARLLDDFVLDASHIARTLEWLPQVSLDQGLARAIAGRRPAA
jgi:nucleoside-diphosphate-sugar epimerase